jgi:hypothetical protein
MHYFAGAGMRDRDHSFAAGDCRPKEVHQPVALAVPGAIGGDNNGGGYFEPSTQVNEVDPSGSPLPLRSCPAAAFAATSTSASTTSAATSATGALPGAAGDRTDTRSGTRANPQGALLRGPHPPCTVAASGPHPPCTVAASGPRDRPEPGAVRRRGFPVKLVVGRR